MISRLSAIQLLRKYTHNLIIGKESDGVVVLAPHSGYTPSYVVGRSAFRRFEHEIISPLCRLEVNSCSSSRCFRKRDLLQAGNGQRNTKNIWFLFTRQNKNRCEIRWLVNHKNRDTAAPGLFSCPSHLFNPKIPSSAIHGSTPPFPFPPICPSSPIRPSRLKANGLAAIRNLLRICPESVTAEILEHGGTDALVELRRLVGAPGEPWSSAAARAVSAATDSLDAMRLQVKITPPTPPPPSLSLFLF